MDKQTKTLLLILGGVSVAYLLTRDKQQPQISYDAKNEPPQGGFIPQSATVPFYIPPPSSSAPAPNTSGNGNTDAMDSFLEQMAARRAADRDAFLAERQALQELMMMNRPAPTVPGSSVEAPVSTPVNSGSNQRPQNQQVNPVNSPNIQVPTNVSPVITFTPQNIVNIQQPPPPPPAAPPPLDTSKLAAQCAQEMQNNGYLTQWGQPCYNNPSCVRQKSPSCMELDRINSSGYRQVSLGGISPWQRRFR